MIAVDVRVAHAVDEVAGFPAKTRGSEMEGEESKKRELGGSAQAGDFGDQKEQKGVRRNVERDA